MVPHYDAPFVPAGDFDRPRIEAGHPLRRPVLYCAAMPDRAAE